jgi:hypothetical protein
MKSAKVTLTESQYRVASFMAARAGKWLRPGEIQPGGYEGGASAVGRVLGSLQELGIVQSQPADRGNGTKCREWSIEWGFVTGKPARLSTAKVAKGGVR